MCQRVMIAMALACQPLPLRRANNRSDVTVQAQILQDYRSHEGDLAPRHVDYT